MKAFVICCNDSIEAVVLEDEVLAEGKIEELKDSDYDKNKSHWITEVRNSKIDPWDNYCRRMYWHLHEVDVIKPKVIINDENIS